MRVRAHDQPENESADHRAEKGDHSRQRDEGWAYFDHLVRIGKRHGARIGGPEIQRQIVDDDGESERYEEDVLLLAATERRDDAALNGVTKEEEEGTMIGIAR